MKIRNINDVITNSSNEVFIYRSNASPEKVLRELKKILGPNHDYSGMGGVLEVASTPDIKEKFDYRGSYLGLPAGYLLVNIDYGYLEDLRGWLKEHLGDPVSDEEKLKLFLPGSIRKNAELLEQLKSVTEVTNKTKEIFNDWCSSCYDLEIYGSEIPEIPIDKVQMFINYYKNKYQELKDRADKLVPESEDWYDLQYDMGILREYIDGVKELVNENS